MTVRETSRGVDVTPETAGAVFATPGGTIFTLALTAIGKAVS